MTVPYQERQPVRFLIAPPTLPLPSSDRPKILTSRFLSSKHRYTYGFVARFSAVSSRFLFSLRNAKYWYLNIYFILSRRFVSGTEKCSKRGGRGKRISRYHAFAFNVDDMDGTDCTSKADRRRLNMTTSNGAIDDCRRVAAREKRLEKTRTGTAEPSANTELCDGHETFDGDYTTTRP